MIAAVWIVAAVLIGLWSLLGWGLHALVTIDFGTIGDVGPWLASVPFADVLEAWFPTWQDLARAALDALQAGLAWMGGAAPTLVWVLWAFGTGSVVVLAGLITLLVLLLRRHAPVPAAAA